MNSPSQNLPRVSIVTPCLNSEAFLEDTIRSVISQGYPNLEYILVDGASSDGTQRIIDRYRDQLTHVIQEPDEGFYHALNKGFSKATGEILGWLNADDLLHPRSLFTVGEVFTTFPELDWITGIPTNIDIQGRFHESYLRTDWDYRSLLSLKDGNPQQESTYWRRSLWEETGGALNTEYQFAADYDLWCRFMKIAELVHVRSYVGGFRKHTGNISSRFGESYHKEREAIARAWSKRIKESPRSFRKTFHPPHRRKVVFYSFSDQCFRLREMSASWLERLRKARSR